MRKERFLFSLRWVCFAVLFTAVVFRLADRRGLSFLPSAAEEESLSPAIAENETQENPVQSENGKETAAELRFPVLYYALPARDKLSASEETAYSAVSIRNPTGIELDLQGLMEQPVHFSAEEGEPLILIVHTHATEAYTPVEGEEYIPDGDYSTLDTAHNVVRVGQAMADRLNENGILTLHDTTLNDVPGYNDAYERMAEVIGNYLREYPSICMVIDLHRDSIETDDGEELALSVELDGKSAAQLLFVMGTDIAGMEHPNWRGNLGFALRLQSYCQSKAPGLFRELSLRTQRYNEHLTPYSVLLEVGSAGNTLSEAITGAEYFADRLTEVIRTGE